MSRVRWGWITIVASASMLALAHIGSINEYRDIYGVALADAYDCDGPTVVLTFSVSALAFVGLGILLLVRSRPRGSVVCIGLAVGTLIVILGGARLAAAITEVRRNTAPHSPCR